MPVEAFIDNELEPVACESRSGGNDCPNLPKWILVTISAPGFAVVCDEHRAGFDRLQQGRDYTVEPYTLERAKDLQKFVRDHYAKKGHQA